MLKIMLITPVYAECGTPAGLYTQALARFYSGKGHRVDVVCAHSWAARAEFESKGRLRVHRLSCNRQNLKSSFACASIRRVHEQLQTRQCDVMIEIDASPFELLRIMRSTLEPFECNVRAIGVERLDDQNDSALPIFSGLWEPPSLESPTLLATPRTDTERQQTIDIYLASQAPANSWGLSVLERDGSWSHVFRNTSTPPHQDAILMTWGPGCRYLSVLAAEHGISHTHGAISTSVINQAISSPREVRYQQARQRWVQCQLPSACADREENLDSLLLDEQPDLASRWRTLEDIHGLPTAGASL
jgi:hypothetical protein